MLIALELLSICSSDNDLSQKVLFFDWGGIWNYVLLSVRNTVRSVDFI